MSKRPDRPTRSFVFKGMAPDGATKIFVNVTGHAAVGPPQHPSGEPATEAFIDSRGIDNLQVPIAVGDAKEDKKEGASSSANQSKVVDLSDAKAAASSASCSSAAKKRIFTIDVCVHPWIAERCRGVWAHDGGFEALPRERQHLIFRTAQLASDWVKREQGMTLVAETIKLVSTTPYRVPIGHAPMSFATAGNSDGAGSKRPPTMEEIEAMMKELASAGGAGGGGSAARPQGSSAAETRANSDSSSSLLEPDAEDVGGIAVPTSLKFAPASSGSAATGADSAAKKKPLVQEVTSTTPGQKEPVVKRGFLNSEKAAGSLYGDKGTVEGVLPEGAGDPLGYIPKGIRQKCKIVDCRNGTDGGKAIDASQRKAALDEAMPTPTQEEARDFVDRLNSIGKMGELPSEKREIGSLEDQMRQMDRLAQQQPPEPAKEQSQLTAAPAAKSKAVAKEMDHAHYQDPTVSQSNAVFGKPAVRETGGILIEVVDESPDNKENHDASPRRAAVTFGTFAPCAHRPQHPWHLSREFDAAKSVLTITAVIPAQDTSVASMADLDVTVEPSQVICALASSEDDADDDGDGDGGAANDIFVLFRFGTSAKGFEGGFTAAQWTGDAADDSQQALRVDEGGARAQFRKAKRELVLTLPMVKGV